MNTSQCQVSASDIQSPLSQRRAFYRTAWRWHFYAGLYVAPFLIMLAITGLMMMYAGTLENYRYQNLLHVEPAGQRISVSQQLEVVRQQLPEATIKQYLPPKTPEDVSRFAVVTQQGEGLFVTVNPYQAQVLGSIPRDNTMYQLANDIHGTLLIGETGDRLIELAASFGVILLVSGLYLWWPRDNASRAGMFRLRLGQGKRTFWRDAHANVGVVTGVFLLLFLLSGLSWSGVWGSKMVQAWNSFPAGVFGDAPLSDVTHAAMNHGEAEEVPWNLEQTPMPMSVITEEEMTETAAATVNTGSHHAGHHMMTSVPARPLQQGIVGNVNIDSVTAFARQEGFTNYRLNLPQSATDVYTIMASTMGKDITDATQDRTMHIDQYSGKVLADVKYADYTAMAKTMAWGIALHEGDMGYANKAVNTVLCLSFVLISLSGIVMWWLRRPKGKLSLSPPPAPNDPALWKGAMVVIAVLGVCFPLAGLAIVTVLVLDWLVISRVAPLSRLFG